MSKKVVSREEVIQAEANAVADNSEEKETLSWRDDPEQTFSDWKIEVSSTNGIVDSYHVHKIILGRGPRKGKYFQNMFQGRFKEEGKSLLTLHPLAASCFPNILDFAYESPKELKIDTQSAAALLHLGSYLGMELVCQRAAQFVRSDMEAPEAMNVYVDHSEFFPEVYDVMVDFLTTPKNLLKLLPGDAVVDRSPLAVWEQVAGSIITSKETGGKKELGEQLSRLVAGSLKALTETPEGVQEVAPALQQILSEDCMPVVHPEAALDLAELALLLPDQDSSALVPSLWDRCSRALPLSEKFQHLLSVGDPATRERLKRLPSSFVTTAWWESLQEDRSMERKRREFKEKHQAKSYREVLDAFLKNEKARRKDLNAALSQVRAASPQASFDELRLSPHYQLTAEEWDMEREVFNELLDFKSLEATSKGQTIEEEEIPVLTANNGGSNSQTTAAKNRSGADGEDPYPIGLKVFVRDTTDGFGGLEYPASIIKSKGPDQEDHRWITYHHYSDQHDKAVPVSELLEWTQERKDRFENETIPMLERNERAVDELERKVGDVGEGQETLLVYEKNKVYFVKDGRDKIEYPAKLIRFCEKPGHTHKCVVKYLDYKETKTMECRKLLEATEKRWSKYREHQAFGRQERQRKVEEKQKRAGKGKNARANNQHNNKSPKTNTPKNSKKRNLAKKQCSGVVPAKKKLKSSHVDEASQDGRFFKANQECNAKPQSEQNPSSSPVNEEKTVSS